MFHLPWKQQVAYLPSEHFVYLPLDILLSAQFPSKMEGILLEEIAAQASMPSNAHFPYQILHQPDFNSSTG